MANINKIKLSGTTYNLQDENATKVVSLTQAQYDALATKDPNTLYNITDAQAGDLTNYYTKTETDDLLDEKLDVTAYTPTDLSNYYTKSETSGATQISTALGAKADTATTYTRTQSNYRYLSGVTYNSGATYDSLMANKGDGMSSIYVGYFSKINGKSIGSNTTTNLNEFNLVETTAFTAHTADTNIHVTSTEKTAWNNKSDFSGSYNDLTDKPTIPTVPTSNTAFTNDAGYATTGEVQTALLEKADKSTTYTKTETDNQITAITSTKQDTLVSGTNIKTINNESILGSGNITIEGGGGGTVDPSLNSGSTNPVANSAITESVIIDANNRDSITAVDYGGFKSFYATQVKSISFTKGYTNDYVEGYILLDNSNAKYTFSGDTSSSTTLTDAVTLNLGSKTASISVKDRDTHTIKEIFFVVWYNTYKTQLSYAYNITTNFNPPLGVNKAEFVNKCSHYGTNVDDVVYTALNNALSSKLDTSTAESRYGNMSESSFCNQYATYHYSNNINNGGVITKRPAKFVIEYFDDSIKSGDILGGGLSLRLYSTETDSQVAYANINYNVSTGVATFSAQNSSQQTIVENNVNYSADTINKKVIFWTGSLDDEMGWSEYYFSAYGSNSGWNNSLSLNQNNNSRGYYAYIPESSQCYNVAVNAANAYNLAMADYVKVQKVENNLGGLKLVKLTQSEYDALTTKDSNTLYIING